MNHPRITSIVLVLFAVISGLYTYTKLSIKEKEIPVIETPVVPFNGSVPKEISRGDISKKQIIFTFDAGGGTQSVEQILNVMEKHSVKGAFFITGKWALQNPELVKKIALKNHEIFNHSFNHPYLTSLSDEEIAKELIDTDNTISGIVGSSTKPFFRPPFGDRDLHVLKIAAQEGFQSIYWTVDAYDWRESEGVTADDVRYRILSNVQPGTIVLMHVGDTITGSILDDVFTSIKNSGYEIVSLTQGI